MEQKKLFMLLLGCRPKGRNTEQHDIFFGIGESLKDLLPDIKKSWPEAKGNIHIDAWREVSCVDQYAISIEVRSSSVYPAEPEEKRLFFINLGGYKENEFEEFHYKMLAVADSMNTAKTVSKKNTFYKHYTLPNSDTNRSATSHIDDKYGIDVDDAFDVADILPAHLKEQYFVRIKKSNCVKEDPVHLGYTQLKDL